MFVNIQKRTALFGPSGAGAVKNLSAKYYVLKPEQPKNHTAPQHWFQGQ